MDLSGDVWFNERQLCSIESAARMNPHTTILIFIITLKKAMLNIGHSPLIQTLKTYSNIHFQHINFQKYLKYSKIDAWFKKLKLQNVIDPESLISDIFRYLALKKYGGTYMDLDMISLQTIEYLPRNFIGIENEKSIANGLINIENSKGVAFINQCLRNIPRFYREQVRDSIGPRLVTRILQRLCKVKLVSEMSNRECGGFHVHPMNVFYPVAWDHRKRLFTSTTSVVNFILNLIKKSKTIHMWNYTTYHIKTEKDSVYDILAREYCPAVYKLWKYYNVSESL